MKRYLPLSALSVAAVIALAGCGANTGSSGSVPSDQGAESAAGQPSAGHNEADVMFAQMMIPHHQQAVEMSDIVLAEKGVSADVIALATRIKEAQAPEMETMTGWLESWGEPFGTEDQMQGHHMGAMDGTGGMLSEDEMADLKAAKGSEAVRMFLESMTAHHKGAVDMAQEEVENGRSAEAIALAEMIVEAQEAEIQEMKDLLEELPAR